MDIILQLGGNPARSETGIELAKAYPDAKVVISTGEHSCLQRYTDAGIDPERVIIDDEAWDTVTNLTHTYKLLKKMNCKSVYVVTDMFHTYRANLITMAVWGCRVPFYMAPYGTTRQPKDATYAPGDFLRALLWRLTGILIYTKSTKASRSSIYTNNEKHSLIEIGF